MKRFAASALVVLVTAFAVTAGMEPAMADSGTTTTIDQATVDKTFAEMVKEGNFTPSGVSKIVEGAKPVAGAAGRVASKLWWPVAIASSAYDLIRSLPDYDYVVQQAGAQWFGQSPSYEVPGAPAQYDTAVGTDLPRFSLDPSYQWTWDVYRYDPQTVALWPAGMPVYDPWIPAGVMNPEGTTSYGSPSNQYGFDMPLTERLECKDSASGAVQEVVNQQPFYHVGAAGASGSNPEQGYRDPLKIACPAGTSPTAVTVSPMRFSDYVNGGVSNPWHLWNGWDQWNYSSTTTIDSYPLGYSQNVGVDLVGAAPAEKTYTTTVVCQDGSRQSQATDGSSAWLAQPVCPDKKPAATTEIDSQNKAGGQPMREVTQQTDWSQYPACADGTCRMAVSVDGKPCTVGNADCENWTQIRDADPSRVNCTYGSYAVDVSECNPMQFAYGTTTYLPTDANTSGKSGTTPDVSTVVETGTGTSTTSSPSTNTPDCSGSGSIASLTNPVDWVLTPVKCALEWAFVPDSAAVQGDLQSVKDAWAKTAVGQIGPMVQGWVGMVPTGSGCRGPEVKFTILGGNVDVFPMDACQGPLADIAPVARGLSGALLYGAAGLAIARYIAGVIGFRGLGKGDEE